MLLEETVREVVTNVLILGPHVMDVLLALGSVEMPQVSTAVKI